MDPDQFNDIEPRAEITTDVTFSYPGDGSDDSVTIRALGLGDLDQDLRNGTNGSGNILKMTIFCTIYSSMA